MKEFGHLLVSNKKISHHSL
uniref:Uncharacterized protein n=1 Tax=Arundo donax TaxID=35708 RepID=A0A0A8YDN9_ARUDO